jgi:4-amino-4-deoxy-L-arabinose transferase-like glycosyltransferase
MKSRLGRRKALHLSFREITWPADPWAMTTLLVVAITILLRIHWLANCPLDLAPDEAHYWDWSRHLDWSYYSKGPLVAWLIRASTLLAGHSALAVRLPAVLCGALFLASLYLLSLRVFANSRLAALTVLVSLTLPPVAVMSSIMTIDAPYIACWGWALVIGLRITDCGLRTEDPPRLRDWFLLGVLIGVGILAKYTMVLFIPSLALFLFTSTNHRPLLWKPGFWLMVCVVGLCSSPILIWNWQHDWVTFKHVGGLAKLDGVSPHLHWLGPLAYTGAQFGLLLGFWFIAWIGAMIAHRPWREPDPLLRFLWWMSAPMFLVFLGFSLQTGGGEVNWPVTAYVSGIVLTAGWLWRTLPTISTWRRSLIACGFASTLLLGVALSLLIHQSQIAYPFLGPLAERLYPNKPLALRQFDPTCRLRGWQTLATEVDSIRRQLRAKGTEAILSAPIWWIPGELAFYCEGRPTVYSVGLTAGDRHSQYDLWRPNPVNDPAEFLGKTFILIGEFPDETARAFDALHPPMIVEHRVGGWLVNAWTVRVAEGFRGFPSLPAHSAN